MPNDAAKRHAARVRVHGTVQGVGFRPFVYRLASLHGLGGWVRNDPHGASVHVEGPKVAIDAFLAALRNEAPPAARVERVIVEVVPPGGLTVFEIQASAYLGTPTAHIAPDLAVCRACLSELADPQNRRYDYAYINCTDCGPRYSIVTRLPYDRPHTTMVQWPMCEACAGEYEDPLNRRFHAQPIACPACGPDYSYEESSDGGRSREDERHAGVNAAMPVVHSHGAAAIRTAAAALSRGQIVAIKGIGGYHLACDARQSGTVSRLRLRKYRKEQAFAVMARDLEIARSVVRLTDESESHLSGVSRPIVLAEASIRLDSVAPDNADLGVMLPYTPVHHLLFAAGAPDVLVMTSGNRSSEPIAYQDDEARTRLHGIADGWLVGARPIARRADDSVVRVDGALGPMVIRRGRGLAPGVVATLPIREPLMALGADLKNAVTLVVDGEAIVSQHVGDLEHESNRQVYEQTVADLLAMYGLELRDVTIVHDLHPQYVSTGVATGLAGRRRCAVQHHRAHVASVLAERGAVDARIVGIALDGTGFGDDGAIWGGEIFAGSLAGGLRRVGHLRNALLVGGDAAARYPVQAAAGFLSEVSSAEELIGPPFHFPSQYRWAQELIARGVRTFTTSSMGRLIDCLAALIGFTRPTTFEAQAAMWLEHLARGASIRDRYLMPYRDGELDYRPLIASVLAARRSGRPPAEIACAAHYAIADGIVEAASAEAARWHAEAIVLSGGVCQNMLLMREISVELVARGYEVWTNSAVPANDGGISLGQAAYAGLSSRLEEHGPVAEPPTP